MSAFPPPPAQEPGTRRDRRIQGWIFHVIGAGSVAFQFFFKAVPNPTVVVLSALIGGSPLAYQLWESYLKRKP